MFDWLSHVNPNIVALALGAAAWLYHKARGDRAADHGDLIDSIFGTFAHEVLDRYGGQDVPSYLKTARAYFESRTWDVLAKRGIPRNALTERLVHMATERWSTWLGSQLLPLRNKAPDAPLATVLK